MSIPDTRAWTCPAIRPVERAAPQAGGRSRRMRTSETWVADGSRTRNGVDQPSFGGFGVLSGFGDLAGFGVFSGFGSAVGAGAVSVVGSGVGLGVGGGEGRGVGDGRGVGARGDGVASVAGPSFGAGDARAGSASGGDGSVSGVVGVSRGGGRVTSGVVAAGAWAMTVPAGTRSTANASRSGAFGELELGSGTTRTSATATAKPTVRPTIVWTADDTTATPQRNCRGFLIPTRPHVACARPTSGSDLTFSYSGLLAGRANMGSRHYPCA